MRFCRRGRKSEVDLSDVGLCGKYALISMRDDNRTLQDERQRKLRPFPR